MKIDVKQITEGEDSVTVRYRELTPPINRIISILRDSGGKLWGKSGDESLCFGYDDILYLESVDDKVFAYTDEHVLKIEGSLNSFMLEADNEIFFRCSKSMVMNVNRVSSLKSLSSNRIDAVMEGGEHIIISRRYASEFRKLLRGERE
ncbi:MAG: LytTR family transcriptional regulator DNA-binding domain-containing protein [Lachnospiraceae bacterium]|nr:LytTR family transcriptional regulator DNA-binding domain-containing protein [Lachnospiraceae bacterium]